MLISALNERASVLREEFTRARQNVVAITEQLEQEKAHLNVVSGHLNEVAYLIGEAQKLAPECTESEPAQGVEQHVETNNEAEGQVPQE